MIYFNDFDREHLELNSAKNVWQTTTEMLLYQLNCKGWKNKNICDPDGNPIMVFENEQLQKRIRIIQIKNDENSSFDFSFWIDDFDISGEKPGKELVVSSVITEMSLSNYKWILQLFLEDYFVNNDTNLESIFLKKPMNQLNRLLRFALLEIRNQSLEKENETSYNLANLFHNLKFPLNNCEAEKIVSEFKKSCESHRPELYNWILNNYGKEA